MQKSSRNCIYDFTVKFAKKIYINIFALLHSLVKSQSWKYIAIFPALLILSIKIKIFGIAAAGVVEITKLSNSSKPGFIILTTKYMIFGQSNNTLYYWIKAWNYSDLQIYSNIFGLIVANSISVGTLKNISFKWTIISIFFLKILLILNQISFINDYTR